MSSSSAGRILVVTVMFAASGAPGQGQASDIGFVEDFALADDRKEALRQLVPGTEDHYYYQSLHWQNRGLLKRVDQILPAWIKRHGQSARVREIQNRQALLGYDTDSAASLEFIRRRLGLQFNHQRQLLDRKPTLRTALDQRLISRSTLTHRALRRNKNLDGFEDRALDWLVETELDPLRRRNLLSRLSRPDHPGLAKLVVDDLAAKDSRGFGSLPIHKLMLPVQLEQCAGLDKRLLNHTAFVNVMLDKLRPGPEEDRRHDADVRRAHLDRLWSFARRLSVAHNSLKACILYHRLVLDRSQGVYDRKRFERYLELPRHVAYVRPQFLKLERNRRHIANLSADFQAHTLLPPVANDEPLVRSYLEHFFVDAKDYEDFEKTLRDTYVKRVFAETKILNGIGDMARWYTMLDPAAVEALRRRVDLAFAFTNRTRFDVDDQPVRLELDVKNVKKLIVKVYKIDNLNIYLSRGVEVDTDINLDGLVANWQKTYEYDEPALRRVRRTFAFDELAGRGTYVIDFIGNGRSSRALVRKGRLRFGVCDDSAGHRFTILDQSNRKLVDAALYVQGHRYEPDEDGQITVPYTNQPGRRKVILVHEDFASLDQFEHRSESYRLEAGFHVDREGLQTRAEAHLLVRPTLRVNGTPVPTGLLEEVTLTVTSVDHDGVSTSRREDGFELYEDRESIFTFKVPQRPASISFRLGAKIKSLSRGETVNLSDHAGFAVAAITRTEKTEDLHLMRDGDRHIVALLGRTGEPRADRPVNFVLKHRDFKAQVQVTLQTDAAGRIDLGRLEDITWLRATGPQKTHRLWTPAADAARTPATIHGAAGRPVLVPYLGWRKKADRAELSLIEVHDGRFVADRFEALSIRDGYITIEDLSAGDYDLLLKETGRRITIRLGEGEELAGRLLSKTRDLEVSDPQPLHIASIEADNEAVTIRVAHTDDRSRVHVVAMRYEPAFSMYRDLVQSFPEPAAVRLTGSDTVYAAGRRLGDEHRYILDRKYAPRFAGNMLARPGLLLHPWALGKIQTAVQRAQAGTDFDAAGQPEDSMLERAAQTAASAAGAADESDLDFLARPSVVLANLKPDGDGIVRIDRAKLGDRHRLHVVAVGPTATVSRHVALEAPARQFADLRLLKGLDPALHFTERREVSIVAGGEAFVLEDVATGRFEIYDDLGKVYTLYATLSGNATLAQFKFILDWPKLEDEQKRKTYSTYACHELNFFLFMKDRSFFDRVVAPTLASKLDKTFMDRWLLGEDLASFLEPWSYQRTNIVERVLLGRRLDAEGPAAARHVSDLFDLLPPDVENWNHIFDTALKAGALQTVGVSGVLVDALSNRKAGEVVAFGFTNGHADAPAATLEIRGTSVGKVAQAAGKKPKSARAFEALAAKDESEEEDLARSFGEASDAAGRLGDDLKKAKGRRSRVRGLYRKLDKTQEWAENNYYKIAIEKQVADLVTVNALWRDAAAHREEEGFLSRHLAEATGSFTQMMLALALLDLPFEAPEHRTEHEAGRFTLRPGAGAVVYHRQIRPTEPPVDAGEVMVRQNFYRHSDRYRHEQGRRLDKFVTEEFLTHAVYGCQVVITNPTSTPRRLDLLTQIPGGSIPVLGARQTRSVHVQIDPYHTKTVEYHFYFPQAGRYGHFPVHVASQARLAAAAEPFLFNVVDKPSRIDRESWDYISQHGMPEQVVAFLETHNLGRIDLERIAWRMQDQAFFGKVIQLLDRRHVYHPTLWSYAIKHDDPAAIRQFLKHADGFVNKCGSYIDSTLLRIDPVERRSYQHLEYSPLVNARAHWLGPRRRILNDRVHAQYQRLMKILCARPKLDDHDLMSVTYYLLLQDRIDEARRFFSRVDGDSVHTRLQHDYITAYLDFFTPEPARAGEIAARYADHPVERWRKLFAAVAAQLDELAGRAPKVVDEKDRTEVQTRLAATEPGFDFRVEGQRIVMNHQNLDRVRVHYYLMDIELLFSHQPFVQAYSSQFSWIRPNHAQTVELPADRDTFEFELPAHLRTANVMIQIHGGAVARSRPYLANALAVQLIENYGRLRVTHQDTGKPYPAVYVKVYARMQDGRVRFYKDGYTDLRGRFDYTSLNTDELDGVERFSVLLLSDEDSAVIREAAAPKR
jgi:hypothetical protein